MTVRIERVVLALDATSDNRAAIDTAVRLAARWRAKLRGVFVEDDELLRFATLPFARQVSLGGGVERLTRQQAEHQLRAFAEQARRELEAAARPRSVQWSFDIVHGLAGLAIGEATATDFLITGTATRPVGGHFRIAHRWWSVVGPAPTSFLLASRIWSTTGSVVALLNNRDEAGERLIDAAAQIAEAGGDRLVIVCRADLAAAEGFGAWLGEMLARYIVPVDIDSAPADDDALLRRTVGLGCQLLAIGAGDPQAQQENLRNLVGKLDCDVLVVR